MTIGELQPYSLYKLVDVGTVHYHLKLDNKQFISIPNFGTDKVGIESKMLDSRLAVVGEYGEETGWLLDRKIEEVISSPIKKLEFKK